MFVFSEPADNKLSSHGFQKFKLNNNNIVYGTFIIEPVHRQLIWADPARKIIH